MPAQAPGRLWVIRHQDQGKPQAVAKFDTAGGSLIPDAVADRSTFEVLEVSSRSGLADQTIDHTVLSDTEKDVLSQVYPIR